MAVSLFQVVLKEYHSEPSRATAETGGKCCLLRLGLFYTALHGLFSLTLAFLGEECCPNSPRNLPYPSVSSPRQPLQEVASHVGTGNKIPLAHCILSSHAVIFTHFKFCMLQSHTVPTNTQCPFPSVF